MRKKKPKSFSWRTATGDEWAEVAEMVMKNDLRLVSATKRKREREPAKKLYLTATELQERWCISPAYSYKVGDIGKLPVMYIGAAKRYPLEAVERFEKENTR